MDEHSELVERGRAYLARNPIPPGIELFPGSYLDTETVARSLRCLLTSVWDRGTDPSELEPTVSRVRGRPHLPEGAAWPIGTYFEAQLDLAEIAGFGLWPTLPQRGTAYVFFDPSTGDMRPYSTTAGRLVLVENAPVALAEAPAATDLPYGGEYYAKHFLARSHPLQFEPRFAVDFADRVPDRVLAGLEAELGMAHAEATDSVIGGSPTTYQGEDEDELFAPQDWDWHKGLPEIEPRFLLLQDDFGEGHAHFWLRECQSESGTARLALDVTYSGT